MVNSELFMHASCSMSLKLPGMVVLPHLAYMPDGSYLFEFYMREHVSNMKLDGSSTCGMKLHGCL